MKKLIGSTLAVGISLSAAGCSSGHPLPREVQQVLQQSHNEHVSDSAIYAVKKLGALTVSFAGTKELGVSTDAYAAVINYMARTTLATPSPTLPIENGYKIAPISLALQSKPIFVIGSTEQKTDGFTITDKGPVAVSILSAGDKDGEIAATEACQATTQVLVKNAVDAADNLVGQEAWCNGIGRAYAGSHHGIPYTTYVDTISNAPTIKNANDNYTAYMPVIDEDAYNRMAHEEVLNLAPHLRT